MIALAKIAQATTVMMRVICKAAVAMTAGYFDAELGCFDFLTMTVNQATIADMVTDGHRIERCRKMEMEMRSIRVKIFYVLLLILVGAK
jgi:hypothetical protein